jgi:hypothetical protein
MLSTGVEVFHRPGEVGAKSPLGWVLTTGARVFVAVAEGVGVTVAVALGSTMAVRVGETVPVGLGTAVCV